MPPTQEELELERRNFDFARSLAAFADGRIVGTAGAYAFELTLPGATLLPVSGVSWVGVLPTYRRRGILRALMKRQLADVQARGEALAILLASESTIYGRFGYGVATTQVSFEIDRHYGSFLRSPERPGHLSIIDRDAAATMLPEIYDRARRRQPGQINRSPIWWEVYLRDLEKYREGASERFYVVYKSPQGAAEGYAAYRIKEHWEAGLPGNTLILGNLIAATPAAHAALWDFCLNVDLVKTIRADRQPPDDPVRWMLADSRRLRTVNQGDFLWARLVDIPTALSARRYATGGQLVFAVTDSFCPANTGSYHLDGSPEGAEAHRVEASPDLALGVDDLGAAYLGGVRFSTLARAGRVRELSPGALVRADLMFTSEPLPWSATGF